MKTLPHYINFASAELAMACCYYLKDKHGFTLNGNVTMEVSSTPCIRVYDKKLNYYSREHEPDAVSVSSIKEFLTLIGDAKILVGTYVAEFKTDGVQVGCTFVDWATVKAIAERAP